MILLINKIYVFTIEPIKHGYIFQSFKTTVPYNVHHRAGEDDNKKSKVTIFVTITTIEYPKAYRKFYQKGVTKTV